MRKVKINPKAIEMLLRPRGRYHISLALMFDCEKIKFPEEVYDFYLAGTKYEQVEIEPDKIPLTEQEVELLHTVISRNGKTLAETTGIDSVLVTKADGAADSYIRYNKTDENYLRACALYLCHRTVTNIHFIDTVRGEVYIRCDINGIPQPAKRMKRTQSRNLDKYDEEEYFHLAAMYYFDKLIKNIK